jgi:hypothetical protein
MRWVATSLMLVGLAIASAAAKPPPSAASPASVASAPVSSTTPHLTEGGYYVNRDRALVHRPSHTDTGAAPAGASAQCADGSYSFSQHARGTCSHHGGVARWL